MIQVIHIYKWFTYISSHISYVCVVYIFLFLCWSDSYTYIYKYHLAVHQKLIQHCKSTILQIIKRRRVQSQLFWIKYLISSYYCNCKSIKTAGIAVTCLFIRRPHSFFLPFSFPSFCPFFFPPFSPLILFLKKNHSGSLNSKQEIQF